MSRERPPMPCGLQASRPWSAGKGNEECGTPNWRNFEPALRSYLPAFMRPGPCLAPLARILNR